MTSSGNSHPRAEPSDKRHAWRVVLVDDHPMILETLRVTIESASDLTVTHCLEDSASLTRVLRTERVDVIVLDYRLADDDFDGVSMIERLRSRFPAIRLLVISACDDHATVAATLMAGAHGFLSKGAALDECVRALHVVAGGGRYENGHTSLAPGLPSSLAARLDTVAPHDATSMKLPYDLSVKEFDALRCLLQGFSVSGLTGKFRRSVKTVSGHKMSAMRKMGIQSELELFQRRPRSRDNS